MANMLMMRYAASRSEGEERGGNQPGMRGLNDRRNTYDQPGMGYSGGADMRQPNQYTTRSEYDSAESRYRGKDGRWHSGTRRSMGMEEPMSHNDELYDTYMGEGEEEDEQGRKYKIEVMPSNVIPFHEPRENYRMSRQIGFGAQDSMEREGGKEEGYTIGKGHQASKIEFDRHTAEKWVRSMRNEDKSHPVGGKWSADMLKPLAQKYGIPTEGKKFWEFYAMTNAMYSDYGEVARKFGITSPEFYVCMAKAWMDDKDAEPEKTALYYEYIVKKEDMGAAA